MNLATLNTPAQGRWPAGHLDLDDIVIFSFDSLNLLRSRHCNVAHLVQLYLSKRQHLQQTTTKCMLAGCKATQGKAA